MKSVILRRHKEAWGANMTINVSLGNENPKYAVLSNLARTPFKFDTYLFPTVEGFIQGLKFKDRGKQHEVFGLDGKEALKAGRVITRSIIDPANHLIYWKGQKYTYLSQTHRVLIKRAIKAKFRGNYYARQCLVETGDGELIHDVGKESPATSLPGSEFISILNEIRHFHQKRGL